jgi:hypothetical protein
MEMLSQDTPSGNIYASKSLTYPVRYRTTAVGLPGSYIMYSYQVKAVWRIGATVILNNPNRFFNEKFGLSNYASIAWELVPASFLADWLGNVNNMLDSLTDFDGLTLWNGYHTWYAICTDCIMDHNVIVDPFTQLRCEYSNVAMEMERKTGIPGPTLLFKVPERLSVTRAATAIALLVTLFGNSPRK